LHATYDLDQDGLLNHQELNNHMLAAQGYSTAPLSTEMFLIMDDYATQALSEEREAAACSIIKTLEEEQVFSSLILHPSKRLSTRQAVPRSAQ